MGGAQIRYYPEMQQRATALYRTFHLMCGGIRERPVPIKTNIYIVMGYMVTDCGNTIYILQYYGDGIIHSIYLTIIRTTIISCH